MAERDPDIVAAEFALGTLDADQRAEAEALSASDPVFAGRITQWENWLSALGQTVPPVAPPASLWAKIEERIGAHQGAANRLHEQVTDQIEALRQSLVAWRMAALGAATAAAAIALMWFGGFESPVSQQQPPMRYVAMLQGEKGETGFVVSMALDDMQFVIRPVSAQALDAKSYELWAVMKDGKKPMTLGLVGTEAYAMMDAPPEIDPKELDKGIQLAISVEPTGGAGTGNPMGPVVFAGDFIRLMP